MAIKLNSQQVSALSQSIYSEIRKKADKKYKEQQEIREQATKKLEDSIYKNNPILKEIINGGNYNAKYVISDWMLNKYKKEYDNLPKLEGKTTISELDVRNSIIIKTIDAENLDELIKAIKKEYANLIS